jgi:7-carboxy-7-deazaguanine synthase
MTGAVLPIAETFHSLQGEGTWVGTPMFFIRLAGCNVGKPAPALKIKGPLPILPTGKEAMFCSSWDGRVFPCDTDYNKHETRTLESLIEETWEKHICLTGGEPMLHEKMFGELETLAEDKEISIHIETSGTIKPSDYYGWWITCAPKVGALDEVIEEADELKLLVDEHFHPDNLTLTMLQHKNVFLCPINDITDVRKENVELCLKWLKEFPHWRLSCQVHKFLGLS